jgi:tetratricopeptide (TPR) repeat protein
VHLERLAFAVSISVSTAGLGAQNIPVVAGEHSVMFSGKVTLDDGSPPPAPVQIRRVCDGRSFDAGWTDADGQFTFKVDGSKNQGDPTDASESTGHPRDLDMPIGFSTQMVNPVSTALRDCEVVAMLPGFRSARAPISGNDPHVGALTLHALSRAEALTVSMTTAAAPARAKAAFDKGLIAEKQQRWDDAARELAKAVKEYPKFAIAWFELGMVRMNQHDVASAAQAWNAAVGADPKFVKPYEKLTILADQSNDWGEALKNSAAWIRLDPEDFPLAYLYNAIASARMNQADDAERSARLGIRVDKDGRVPRLRYVLGLILDQKQAYGESAECFREYLKLAPNANDAAVVRTELGRLEQASAAPPR